MTTSDTMPDVMQLVTEIEKQLKAAVLGSDAEEAFDCVLIFMRHLSRPYRPYAINQQLGSRLM